MAIIWVNKGGNDSNSGNSPNNAKKTIQAAVNAAINYDTIIVQSGVYNESVTINKYLTLKGDGVVILDGQNTLQKAIVLGTVELNIVNIIIVNYSSNGITNTGAPNLYITNCMFMNTGLGIGEVYTGTARNCIFVNLSTGTSHYNNYPYNITNCTFVNCGTGVISNGNVNITNSIFYNNTTHINRTAGTSNKNLFYPLGASNNLINNGTPYTDITSWRSATGQDNNSDVLDPLFLDPDNILLGVAYNSPAQYSSFNPNSGAFPYPFVGTGAINRRIGISNNVNSTIWSGGTFTNTEIKADGSIGLVNTNTNGTWESGVLDLQTLSGFTPGSGQTLGLKLVDFTQSLAYPLRVLDADNTDAKPNRLQYEVAFSDDGVNFGPYQKFEIAQIVNEPKRYCKIKVTFRVDGTEG